MGSLTSSTNILNNSSCVTPSQQEPNNTNISPLITKGMEDKPSMLFSIILRHFMKFFFICGYLLSNKIKSEVQFKFILVCENILSYNMCKSYYLAMKFLCSLM